MPFIPSAALLQQGYTPEPLQARDFGVTANGVTNDSPALQAAINAAYAQSRSLQLPYGTIRLVSAVTLTGGIGLDISGSSTNATVIYVVGAGTGFSIDPSVNAMAVETNLRDMRFIGDGSGAGGTGIAINGASPAINLYDIWFSALGTGLNTTGQFCNFTNVRAQSCDVAFYLHQDAVGGGGNNNSFTQVVAQGCTVAFMGVRDSIYPLHSNSLINTSFHTNGCAMYLDGMDHTFATPCAHEDNGLAGTATYVRYGKTIKRSTWHLVGSRITCPSLQITTGPTPEGYNFYLETDSSMQIHECGGTQFLPSVDSTSSISFVGRYDGYGNIPNVTGWPELTVTNPCSLLGEPVLSRVNYPNSVATPVTGGISAFGAGSTAGTELDISWGLIGYVQFAASAGDENTNSGRIRANGTTSYIGVGNIVATSMFVRASVATRVVFSYFQSSATAVFDLVAGKVYRLFVVSKSAATPRNDVISIYPTDSAGAKLNTWNVHSVEFGVGGGSNPAMKGFCSQGWYNPKLEAYTLTNVGTDRAYDASTVAVAELANVVGTLIGDLKNQGLVR